MQHVNQLLETGKQMAKMMKGMAKGQMPELGRLANGAGMQPQTARPGSKGRKKKKRSKARR